MRSGRLRKRASILSLGTTTSAMGQPVEAWTPWATVWAEVRWGGGSEEYEAAQRVAKIDAVIVVRFRDGYSAGMRALVDGQTYKIDAVAEMRHRQEIHLLCTVLQPRVAT